MKSSKIILLAVLLLAAAFTQAAAEYTFFRPRGSFTIEISLENPGPERLRLPIYRNAITSLAVVDGFAIGGTSASEGLSPFLFAANLESRYLETAYDLSGAVPGQRAIRSGFGRIGDVLYAGTIADAQGEGGHLIRVEFTGGEFEVRDLGVPVEGEGVFALTVDPERRMIYGITYPGGRFFTYNISSAAVEVFEETAITEKQHAYYHHYALEPEDILSRALVVDRRGRVYGSRPVNSIFRYDPATGELETLQDELPIVWGRRPLGRADSWALAPDGMIYGGNAGDGQLFRIDPETGSVANLGKPIMMHRMTGLAFAPDGRLWGVAGALPGYAHLFSYDPATGSFSDYGNPSFDLHAPEIAGGIPWRGYQIATVVASPDGRYILLGEDEAQSQLMVFPADAGR